MPSIPAIRTLQRALIALAVSTCKILIFRVLQAAPKWDAGFFILTM